MSRTQLSANLSPTPAGRFFGAGLIGLLALAALLLVPVSGRAQSSFFTTGLEGWTVVSFGNLGTDSYSISGTYAATYVSSGGNPGGYIFSSDPDGGDFTFAAPASYFGNHSSYYGSSLTYSLNDTSAVNYNTTDVIIEGGGLRLLWQSSPVLSPVTSWTTVTATLAPSAQWHVGTTTGSLATISDFTTVLANVTGLFIRGEYAFGADTVGLDSVQFGLVPEPATFALMAAGLLPLGVAGWRSRQKRR